MYDAFSQMELLVGEAGVDRLGRARIAVFGLGGAGSYAGGGTCPVRGREPDACGS